MINNNNNLTFGWGGRTHKALVKKAIGSIEEPLHSLIQPKTIKKNINWPDDFENQFIPGGKFKTAHYYDPKKPVKSLDAWDMFQDHAKKAFVAIKEKKDKKFNKEIARAIHYIQDMSVPVHTRTNNILITHGSYEVFADTESKAILDKTTPVISGGLNHSFVKVAKNNLLKDAKKSRALYKKVASKKTEDWHQVAKETLPDALNSTTEFLISLNKYLKKVLPESD